MKNLLTLIFLHCIAFIAPAQAPQKFAYQSVIRNALNQLVANQSVGIKISVLQGTATSNAEYAETHSPLTNANGLATLEIGGGTVLSGNFANINWADGPFFLKTETDLNGGSNYTITNTTQLLSVPYALYASEAPDQQQLTVSTNGDSLFLQNGGFVIIPGISGANTSSGGGQTGISTHSCGATNVHNPSKTYGTMTDQQGNVYRTIVIGNQEWMAENLKTSIYRNGEPIVTNLTDAEWVNTTNTQIGAYYNDSQYECPYGKLYNGYAVSDPRKICPSGWHMPTDAEWVTLTNSLGGQVVAGGKMKSTGTQHWSFPNEAATNESGFSGLPGGERNNAGVVFPPNGNSVYWWCSSEDDAAYDAYYRGLNYVSGGMSRGTVLKKSGYSVRCLKD